MIERDILHEYYLMILTFKGAFERNLMHKTKNIQYLISRSSCIAVNNF